MKPMLILLLLAILLGTNIASNQEDTNISAPTTTTTAAAAAAAATTPTTTTTTTTTAAAAAADAAAAAATPTTATDGKEPGSDAIPDAAATVRVDIDAAYLYTKAYEDGEDFEVISADNKTISNSHFQARAKTFVIIHGFLSRAAEPWITSLKDQMLILDPGSNVVAVEWSTPAGANYSNATYYNTLQYISPMGASVGRLLDALHVAKDVDYKNFHLIGLNLGAHIAGFAGKRSPSPYGRITGLDPASKGYWKTAAPQRLDKTDALYVDIMHTNSCNNWNFWDDCFGIDQSIGHTDFWPNGGFYQPACKTKKKKHNQQGLRCDHTIVTLYFVESFAYTSSDTKFLARPAKTYDAYKTGPVSCGSEPQYMGILADSHGLTGDFYLNTSSEPPYALDDWRCPTDYRKHLYHASTVMAKIAFFIVGIFMVMPAACFMKISFSNGYLAAVGKDAYQRFDVSNRGYDGTDEGMQQTPAHDSYTNPIRRFLDDLSRPQTPVSIPESMGAYASASEMLSVTKSEQANDRRNNNNSNRSLEELVRHQDNLSRVVYDRSRYRHSDSQEPEDRQAGQTDRERDIDLMYCESVSSRNVAGAFDSSRLAFNDAASEAGSLNLWREMNVR